MRPRSKKALGRIKLGASIANEPMDLTVLQFLQVCTFVLRYDARYEITRSVRWNRALQISAKFPSRFFIYVERCIQGFL